MDFLLVAFLPLAINDEVALLKLALHLLTVHLDNVAQALAVSVCVEVAGHHFTLHPTWNADVERILTCPIVYLQRYIAIPRIVGLLREGDSCLSHLHVHCVGIEKVDVESVVLYCIDILRQRRNEASRIGGTACTAKPFLTLVLTHALQRVGIEEFATINGDA